MLPIIYNMFKKIYKYLLKSYYKMYLYQYIITDLLSVTYFIFALVYFRDA